MSYVSTIRNIFGACAPIKLPPFDLTIFSGASLECWGDTDQVTEIGGRWNCIENKCHINSLELQAAFFCLKAFCKNKTRLHVLLKLDSRKKKKKKNSSFVDNLSWTTNSHTTYAQCYLHGPVPRYGYLSYHWTNKMLQTNQAKTASCLQSICGR